MDLNKDSLFTIGECNLEEVLEDTLVLLKYSINKNNIVLNLNIKDKDIILPFNKDNLKQVFLNLLLNSIDAINLNDSHKPRKIFINAESRYDYSIIEIIDTGVGISKEELDKVFDPFYTTKDSGTGIGLPIVLNIINNSGGKMSIESSENNGTKATLLIPLANERKE